jgi:hypothetical protein
MYTVLRSPLLLHKKAGIIGLGLCKILHPNFREYSFYEVG